MGPRTNNSTSESGPQDFTLGHPVPVLYQEYSEIGTCESPVRQQHTKHLQDHNKQHTPYLQASNAQFYPLIFHKRKTAFNTSTPAPKMDPTLWPVCRTQTQTPSLSLQTTKQPDASLSTSIQRH